MNLPISTLNTEHYLWGDACDGWRLLKHDDISVIQERVPSNCAEVMHYHRTQRGNSFSSLKAKGLWFLKIMKLNCKKGMGWKFRRVSVTSFAISRKAMFTFLVVSVPTTRGDRINL